MPTCRVAGHSGSVAGPWCCPVKIGPTLPARGAADVLRCRPVADVLPVVLPGQDRPHAPGPVVLPTCCAAGRLPTCCPWCCRSTPGRLPHAPGRSLGKRCRPVVLPGQDRPHAPGPVVLPTCCAARQLFYVLRFRRFSGAIPALPFHLLALCQRVNRYNPTHFHFFYGLFCCFRTWQAEICP